MSAAPEAAVEILSADEMQAKLMEQIQSISDTAFAVIDKCMQRRQVIEFHLALANRERDALRAVLKEIVREYHATYDASNDGGVWKGAAQIDARLMERAERLVGAK